MAAPDHTALIRRFFAMDGTLTAPSSSPRSAGLWEFTERPLTSRDGVAKVADTLADLLTDSGASRHTQCLGWPMEPSRWPFTSVYADGIGAAVHDLRPCTELLERLPK